MPPNSSPLQLSPLSHSRHPFLTSLVTVGVYLSRRQSISTAPQPSISYRTKTTSSARDPKFLPTNVKCSQLVVAFSWLQKLLGRAWLWENYSRDASLARNPLQHPAKEAVTHPTGTCLPLGHSSTSSPVMVR